MARTGYYVEKRYCEICMVSHWLEVITTRHGTREVCRGEKLEDKLWGAGRDEKYILKHVGHGCFKVTLVKLTKKGLPVLSDERILQDDFHVSTLQVDF